jgi:hypothetical protein
MFTQNKWFKRGALWLAVAGFLWASGIVPQAYNLIQGNGSSAARGTTLNFANTATVTWSCTTTGAVTACSATGSGGGGSAGGGIVTYSNSAAAPTGTAYIPIGGGGLGAFASTEANVQVGAPSAATISSLFVTLSAALGTGNSIAVTWRKAGSSQTLTCTISNPALTCSDTTHNFTVAQSDLIDIQIVTTGTVVVTPILTIATAYGVSAVPVVKFTSPGFTSQTSVTITHNLGTVNVQVQCWDASSPANVITPSNIAATNSNVVTVTFDSSQSGSCVVIG